MEASKGIDFIVLIIIASMGIFILVFFIILLVLLYQKKSLASRNQLINLQREHQEQLLHSSLEIAEHERQIIAANLHDDIGGTLHTLKMNLERLFRNRGNEGEFKKIMQSSIGDIDNSMTIMRGIYYDIVPPGFKEGSLTKALFELCARLKNNLGLQAAYLDKGGQHNLDPNTQVELYRLINEIITNTVKHAGPDKIEITLEIIEKTLIVTILHNGKGITTRRIKELAKDSKGIGLKSILTRSQLLNASVDFLEDPKVVIRMLLV